jgi:serine/threonine-protein kinase
MTYPDDDRLGPYVLLEVLGRNGRTVYRARPRNEQREVRITIRRLYDQNIADFIKVRENDANVVLSLIHPNIVRILEFNAEGVCVYVVEEWVEAEALFQINSPAKPLPLQRVSRILSQIADALDYLHQHRIAHGELSRFNVLIGTDDHVYLRDLRIVDSLTSNPLPTLPQSVGTGIFKVDYVAPERVRGTPANIRSDIYELGTLVYEMLLGDVPYKGNTPLEILKRKDQEDPPPFYSDGMKKGIAGAVAALVRMGFKAKPGPKMDLPEHIQRVVTRAIARSPEQRFGSAGEFAAAFHTALIGSP